MEVTGIHKCCRCGRDIEWVFKKGHWTHLIDKTVGGTKCKYIEIEIYIDDSVDFDFMEELERL